MTILTIIGFVAMLFVAIFLTTAMCAIFIGGLCFSGKVGPEAWFFVALTAIAWVVVFYLQLFEIALKGGAA